MILFSSSRPARLSVVCRIKRLSKITSILLSQFPNWVHFQGTNVGILKCHSNPHQTKINDDEVCLQTGFIQDIE